MSMSVPYTPPDYVPPEVDATTWTGPERRSQDPVNRLSRSFNRLCLEATDPYEIVAHLEALGYNTPSMLARLGMEDHFKLAEALYARTPKSFAQQRPDVLHERNWVGPVTMVMALVVTFGLGAYATANALLAATWVLIWSQASAALLSRAEGDLGRESRARVLTILLRVGVLGLGLLWAVTRFGPSAAAPALLWFGVAALLWGKRYVAALALPVVAALGLAAGPAFGWSPVVAQAITSVVALVATAPLMFVDAHGVRRWIARRWREALFPALYGLGQGLLIIGMVWGSPDEAAVVPGAVLLAVILLTSQALLARLKQTFAALLWEQRSDAGYVAAARLRLAGYALVYLSPVLVAWLIQALAGAQPWMYHWYAFAVFGLALALAVVSISLGNAVVPGVTFAVAGFAALFAPFLLVGAVLAVVQFAWTLRWSGKLERYALFLL
jgi:hypothetical protein